MATGLQTLQGLYKSGVSAPTPVVMAPKPRREDIEETYRTLSLIEKKPKFNLPPLDIQMTKRYGSHGTAGEIHPEEDDIDQGRSRFQKNKKRRQLRRNRRNKRRQIQRQALLANRRADNRRVGHQKGGSGGSGFGGYMGGLGKYLFGKDDKKDKQRDSIWLDTTVILPSSSSSSSTGGLHYPSSSSSSSTGYKKRRIGLKGKYTKDKYLKGSSSSSSSGAPVHIPKQKKSGGLFHCSVGRTEKGDDLPLIKFTSIAAPLILVGALFGGSLGGGTITTVTGQVATLVTNLLNTLIPATGRTIDNVMAREGNASAEARTFARSLFMAAPLAGSKILAGDLKSDWKQYVAAGRTTEDSLALFLWKLATNGLFREVPPKGCMQQKEDLSNDLESTDETEMVLKIVDDLMTTYKYGFVPKCARNHICKLNTAAASGGPQSTLVPLMSMSAASIFGKPSSNVMDFLHAVWVGRNGLDCDEAYPECNEIDVSSSFSRRSGRNLTDEKLAENPYMDELLDELQSLGGDQASGHRNYVDEAPKHYSI